MYAIIETGGKQYRVQEGDVITVEKLNAEVGEAVTFDKVLLLSDGKTVKTGTPYLAETVQGVVVENGKGKKVIIFKYKAKKDYRKKQGHRQPYSMVKIDAIGGKAASGKTAETKAAKAAQPKAEEKKAPAKAAEKAPAKKEAAKAPAKKETKAAQPKAAEKKEPEKKEPVKKVSASMKKDELIAFAKENGIAVDEKATKAVIIEAIEAALK